MDEQPNFEAQLAEIEKKSQAFDAPAAKSTERSTRR